MAPGCPKSASKTDLGPILVDFWSIFNEVLMLLPPFLLALKRELSVEFVRYVVTEVTAMSFHLALIL